MEPDGRLRVVLTGRLDAARVAPVWVQSETYLSRNTIRAMVVDAGALEYCDGAGLAFITRLQQFACEQSIPVEFEQLSPDIAALLALYPKRSGGDLEGQRSKNGRDFVEGVGRASVEVAVSIREQVTFFGELAVAFGRLLLHPFSLRGQDFWSVAENSGVRALPIIAMLGFLVGLIMAFQGAVSMGQFGAEIYIADFVGLSVLRELGPLITGIILAGRTGSAFAAELGTMKVNEEIDALKTMGLDPVRFLVVPRVLAATLMTPLLAVFTNLFGLIGGAVVMRGIGFPLITYLNRVVAAVSLTDLVSGLFKAVVFGMLVASAGCLSGLRTGEGASAVGHSATRAVVSSIVMIVVADGLFAVVFYLLGI